MITRVIAFDLGGVLVDVDRSALHSLHDSAARIEQAFFENDAHEHLTTGARSADAFIDDAARLLDARSDRVRQAWSRIVAWSPGGQELLQEVTASSSDPMLRVHIWSNTDPIHWEILSRGAAVVDDTALSFTLGCAKPDPRFYAQALADLDPASVLFLDDRPENIEAARAAGVDGVVCNGVAAARAILTARGLWRPRRNADPAPR